MTFGAMLLTILAWILVCQTVQEPIQLDTQVEYAFRHLRAAKKAGGAVSCEGLLRIPQAANCVQAEITRGLFLGEQFRTGLRRISRQHGAAFHGCTDDGESLGTPVNGLRALKASFMAQAPVESQAA